MTFPHINFSIFVLFLLKDTIHILLATFFWISLLWKHLPTLLYTSSNFFSFTFCNCRTMCQLLRPNWKFPGFFLLLLRPRPIALLFSFLFIPFSSLSLSLPLSLFYFSQFFVNFFSFFPFFYSSFRILFLSAPRFFVVEIGFCIWLLSKIPFFPSISKQVFQLAT